MIHLDDALKRYPERLRGFKEGILKECLQYRILDIIYKSAFADRLVFIGGTAIRIVYQGQRFSEDLDFDNRGLDQNDFDEIAQIIRRELEFDGYAVEVKNVFRGAYHCYIRFPGVLFQHGISGHKEQRVLIKIDAEPQDYDYQAKKFLINTAGIFRYINTVDAPLLLSQKIAACLGRKAAKGRDFFDVVFLMSLADPDYGYLDKRFGITGWAGLSSALKERISGINMASLAADVEPFLFDAAQKDRVLLFEEWIESR